MTYKSLLHLWLFLFVWTQTITNYPIAAISTDVYFQWHHLIGIVGIVMLFFAVKRVNIPINTFTVLPIYACILSLVFLPKYGITGKVFNLIYAVVAYIVVYNLCDSMGNTSSNQIICTAGLIYLIMVGINTLINWQAVVECIKGHRYHPQITTFIGGGVNLEATYLAYFSVFFLHRKKYWYWLFTFGISVVYASRVGIVLSIAALMLHVFPNIQKITVKKLFLGGGLTVIGAILIAMAYRAGFLDTIIRRFLTIGSDGGSMGRLRMWEVLPKIFSDSPFGCGFGNAIKLVRRYTGLNLTEENIHNVYFQYLIELGIPGITMLLVIVAKTGIAAKKARFEDPKINILLLIFLSYVVQARGTEPILYIMMGLVHVDAKEYRLKGKNPRSRKCSLQTSFLAKM